MALAGRRRLPPARNTANPCLRYTSALPSYRAWRLAH